MTLPEVRSFRRFAKESLELQWLVGLRLEQCRMKAFGTVVFGLALSLASSLNLADGTLETIIAEHGF